MAYRKLHNRLVAEITSQPIFNCDEYDSVKEEK
ncbi:hypothetical protein SAG0356_03025 [Streptococcus agalactiae GB00911]|nr:hypothetical protein SAG0323_05165 [Streptococcus agalactiae GB00279]EPV52332.1 hypothetical protein SAG0356_03025 [Streptococcus agalactiae GB00911]